MALLCVVVYHIDNWEAKMPADFSENQPINPPVEDGDKLDSANVATHMQHLVAEEGLHLEAKPDMARTAQRLAEAINDHSNFINHLGMTFSYENGQAVGRFDHTESLLGNPNFRILHGGVAATMLDTIGGLAGMIEIYRRDQGTLEDKSNKVKRLATVDLRIDYLAPGRGKHYIATAEVIRMGRKGCTTRMMLHNDEGKAIAHGLASYAY
jgi:uncharacterized protein (TIGR00369 family)